METRVAKQILRTAQEARNNYAVTEREFDKVKANMYSIFECYAHGIIDWDTTKKYFRESLKKYVSLHEYKNREQEREFMREEYKRVTWEYKNALDAYKVVAEQKLAKNLLSKVEFIGESVAQSQAQKYYTQRMLSESEVRDTVTLSWKRVMEAYPNLTAKDEDRVRMLTIFESPTMDTTQLITSGMDEGYKMLPPMDKEKYQPRDGLEGPFSTLSGKVVYYDPKEGSYYDPDTDMYMSYDDFRKLDNDYSDMEEGKSPHPKGSKKYKAHMAAMHANSAKPEGKMIEREMSKSEKDKEERLKDKYDDSDMKQSMKDQYGDDWKNVYYATIRKQAMENVAGAFAGVAMPMGKPHRRKKANEAEEIKYRYAVVDANDFDKVIGFASELSDAKEMANRHTKNGISNGKIIKLKKPMSPKKGDMMINRKFDENITMVSEAEFDEAAGEKDACYHKVKSRYKVWPSAYASGALVQCRKVGAKNWGNKSKKK